ncbi:MAG: ABC transporter ATP-binding protein [Thermotogota bacterium]|nr:ABC transporter ATP-binding protein [Thermotogota bacterium]
MLSLSNITHVYQNSNDESVKALLGINTSFELGSINIIVGSNGSGKSTLLLISSGLLKPTFGTVSYSENSVKSNLRYIGFVFQYPENYFFEENVFKEVTYAAKNYKLDNLKKGYSYAMNCVGLDPEKFAGISPFELSGGEKRKVAIACSLVHDPDYLFFDEPTASLDDDGLMKLKSLITNLKKSDKTVIISTHWPEDFLDITDNIIALNSGRKAFEGNIKKFIDVVKFKHKEFGLVLDKKLQHFVSSFERKK